MTAPTSARPLVRFGTFEVDLTDGELRHKGIKVKLQEQPFRILATLLEQPGTLVTREQLRERLWPADTFVDFEHSLNAAVKNLRRALGDDAENPRFIETVPKRGYKFIAAIAPSGSEPQRKVIELPVEAPSAVPGIRRTRTMTLGAAAAILVLVLLAGWLYWRSANNGDAIDSVAVLPFTNANGDPNMEYLADGITENLINSLSQLPKLRVVALGIVIRYKGQKIDAQKIGRDLNVRAVLIGRVLQPDDHLTIATELVDVTNGSHLWGEQYNREFRDILAVQEEISKEITEKLRPSLTGAERQRLAKRQTVNTAAYREYLMGRHYWLQFRGASLKQALQHFEKAVELDPNYALAHAGVADSYTSFATYRILPPSEAYPKARIAAQKALELDPELSEAYSALGLVSLYDDWDWPAAERAFRRAIQFKPDNAEAHNRYALALAWFERFDEALGEIRRAAELDPLLPRFRVSASQILYHARRYDQAVEEIRQGLSLDPNFFQAHQQLGWVFVQTRAYEAAIAEFKKAKDLGGGSQVEADLAYVYAVSRETDRARTILDELIERSTHTYISPFDIAVVYVGLGDREQAFAWLAKAYDERARPLLGLRINPRLDSLRSDPRFVALVRRVKVFDAN
jgi:TolB-like protein/DNA-binding winged helix-turn-helix (wHTH) protein/Tfp pilus assembly protein PilF